MHWITPHTLGASVEKTVVAMLRFRSVWLAGLRTGCVCSMGLVRKAYQATTCSVRSLATDVLNALKLEIDPFSFRGPTVMDAQSPILSRSRRFLAPIRYSAAIWIGSC